MKKLIAFFVFISVLAVYPVFALSSNSHSADFEDSSSQYLSIADASQTGLDFSDDVSIACWINFEARGVNEKFVSKMLGTGNQRSYAFTAPLTTTIQFEIYGNGGYSTELYTASVTWSSSNATWYHLAMTKDGTSVKFFVNGSQQGTTQTMGGSAIFNGTANFEIGGISAFGDYFDGKMDDCRVWDRAISDSEVSNLYSDPCNFDNGTNLQGWWTLDNALTDGSGNSNNLTNNNSVTFSTSVPYECAAAASTAADGFITID